MAKFNIEGLDHVAIGVADVERSQRFYAETLGFERLHEAWDVPVVMGTGSTGLAIFDKELHPSPTPDDVEAPAVRILHIAFRLGRTDFASARRTLEEAGVEARFSDHGISHSLYLRDPDGHQIELTTYDVAG